MEDLSFLQKVVEEVIKRLKVGDRRILALFCGGTIGAEEGRSELKKLVTAGYKVRIVFTPAAEKVLGEEWVRSELGNTEIITETDRRSASELLKETDIILVPVLTLNSAAKVAHGIADTLVTTLIMSSLLSGKCVVAARNACDLNNPIRAKLGMNRGNAAYQRLFADCLTRLEQYGIRLVDIQNLAAVVEGEVESSQFADGREAVKAADRGLVFSGRILSRADVATWTEPILKVTDGTLITPLARDVARDRGIEIIQS
ncbi:flavoprotein [Neomoorella carbonis]|uniref:flavoprotein n=1 Tax=Neomoorella carbonis TaxID=3062783 RepID=UPI00324E98F5